MIMRLRRSSITEMHHTRLSNLAPFLGDTLGATGEDDTFEAYSYEDFRRLYNDAVETMQYYWMLAQHYHEEYEHFRDRYYELFDEVNDL